MDFKICLAFLQLYNLKFGRASLTTRICFLQFIVTFEYPRRLRRRGDPVMIYRRLPVIDFVIRAALDVVSR